jgi:hypothetical protein
MSLPPFSTRPDEVPDDAPLPELVTAYQHHVHVVVVERLRLANPDSADALFRHAIAALALLHAVTERLSAGRWATVSDALAADAGRAAEVAAACGLDGTEVAAGLRSWAAGQVEAGLMSPPEWGAVQLMARSVGGER